jgi:hypothetical protein
METRIPKTNRECYALLDEMLSEEDKQYIVEKGTDELHFTLGLWIRNNWLYPQSQEDTEKLMKTFSKNAQFYHPDDFSSIILEAYLRHLKRKKKL